MEYLGAGVARVGGEWARVVLVGCKLFIPALISVRRIFRGELYHGDDNSDLRREACEREHKSKRHASRAIRTWR